MSIPIGYPPFCITSFRTSAKAGDLNVMAVSAAIRFDRNPCQCDGCQRYAAELSVRGLGDRVENVEVRP